MEEIKKTSLHERHLALHAKMEEFAGYDMPIVYSSIPFEHQAVRDNVGMFDVSHMGEFLVKGKDAVPFVEYLFTNEITSKENGKVTYGLFLYDNGTVVDDLLVYKVSEEELFLVVNASNIAKDYEWVVSHTEGYDVTVSNLSHEYSEIAVQGPKAEEKVKEVLGFDLSELGFFCFGKYLYRGANLIISRTGYTGEDGFEIYTDNEMIVDLWDEFALAGVTPCGLGSRDTLRFEATLPLYGHEISDEITPIMARLKIFVKMEKENFIGKKALEEELANGSSKQLVGIELTERAIPRAHYPVYFEDNEIGHVTTGYLSISVGAPIALALIDSAYTKLGTQITVGIRNKKIPGFVRNRKFLKKNYKTN